MDNLKKMMYSDKKFKNCIMIDAILNNVCQRCGNHVEYEYCDNCEELGKLSKGDKLYLEKGVIQKKPYIGKFPTVTLTELQLKASDFILNCSEDALIWAVCGAGKTEIVFATIYKYITMGKKVCFCIPRVDIVYEIFERIRDSFKNIEIALFTGNEKIIIDAHIFIMTTNQILKFYKAFSLIIVDEVDAFPYMYNAKFDYGVNNAKLDGGRVIYLTSTPCEKIIAKQMPTFIIPRRWHNYKLPVPLLLYSKFCTNKLSPLLYIFFRCSRRQKLVFISNINKVEEFSKLVASKGFKVNCVYSSKPGRTEIINKFKNKEFDILITTTILERGVTFDDIDVIVMDANNSHYNEAALIQIAGRVNRKKEYQNGKVIFFHSGITKNMVTCNRKIKYLNKKKW